MVSFPPFLAHFSLSHLICQHKTNAFFTILPLHGPIPADWIRGHDELAYATIPSPHIDSDSGVLETSFLLS